MLPPKVLVHKISGADWVKHNEVFRIKRVVNMKHLNVKEKTTVILLHYFVKIVTLSEKIRLYILSGVPRNT